MEHIHILVFTSIGLYLLFTCAGIAIHMRTESPAQTEIHSVEHYHGNWWSTWHTPLADKLIMATTGLSALSLIAAIIIALTVTMINA